MDNYKRIELGKKWVAELIADFNADKISADVLMGKARLIDGFVNATSECKCDIVQGEEYPSCKCN